MTDPIDPIEVEMRSTYATSKWWWSVVLGLWVVSAILAGATSSPLPHPLPEVATGLAFLSAIATFAARWRAEACYQTAEGLRRARLLSDGLGQEGDRADLARIRASATSGPSGDPPPLGGYYTSEELKGWRRVLHNVQESAFYTESLARYTAWMCTIGVAVVVVATLVLLFVAVNASADGGVAHATGNVVTGAVATIVGGTLADLARAYFALTRAAGTCLERTKVLLERSDASDTDALRAVDAYDAALANAPPIPGFVYRRKQRRLDDLWKASRKPRSAGTST